MSLCLHKHIDVNLLQKKINMAMKGQLGTLWRTNNNFSRSKASVIKAKATAVILTRGKCTHNTKIDSCAMTM